MTQPEAVRNSKGRKIRLIIRPDVMTDECDDPFFRVAPKLRRSVEQFLVFSRFFLLFTYSILDPTLLHVYFLYIRNFCLLLEEAFDIPVVVRSLLDSFPTVVIFLNFPIFVAHRRLVPISLILSSYLKWESASSSRQRLFGCCFGRC